MTTKVQKGRTAKALKYSEGKMLGGIWTKSSKWAKMTSTNSITILNRPILPHLVKTCDWACGREEAGKEKNGCSKLHLMSYICNAGTSLSVQPCAQAPVRSVCDSAFLHATAPQDMAICHWPGLLINTPPTSHDSAHIHTYLHTILLTDGWKGGPRHVWSEQRAREDGGMCGVGWGGGVSNYGETDCKARQEKRCTWHVQKHKHQPKQACAADRRHIQTTSIH